MPPRAPRQPQTPSDHSILLNIARRAHVFLTPDRQAHARIPLSGNTVPLYCQLFRDWLSLAFEERGFLPSSGQYSAILRKLDEDAHCGVFQPLTVHHRIAKAEGNTYYIDLDNLENEMIEVNGKQWTTVYNDKTRFTRPDSSINLPTPVATKAEIHKFLMLQFSITAPQAQMLTTWLVSALLPDCKPPILVITGEANNEAAMQLRSLIDPVACNLNFLPTTKNQYAEVALSNKVLAFQIGVQPTKLCQENLNNLRKGMLLPLKKSSKSRDKIHALLHRPIIIAAGEQIKIHDCQLSIEINETRDASHEQVLGALMDAVVRGIHEMSRQPARVPVFEQEVLIMPGHRSEPDASPPS